MRAEEPLDRGRALLEERLLVGDDGRAVDLGSDHELLLEHAKTGGGAEAELAPERPRAEVVVERAVVEAQSAGVDERPDVAGDDGARRDADVAVARVAVAISGGQVERGAEGERRDVPVLAEEAHVTAQTKIADGRLGRLVVEAVGDAVVAGLVERERQVEGDAHAVVEVQARAEVHEHLVLDEVLQLVAVLVVEDERLVPPVADEARSGAELAAHVERVHDEPLASALRRIEAVEREASRGLRGGGAFGTEEGKGEGEGEEERAEELAHGDGCGSRVAPTIRCRATAPLARSYPMRARAVERLTRGFTRGACGASWSAQ